MTSSISGSSRNPWNERPIFRQVQDSRNQLKKKLIAFGDSRLTDISIVGQSEQDRSPRLLQFSIKSNESIFQIQLHKLFHHQSGCVSDSQSSGQYRATVFYQDRILPLSSDSRLSAFISKPTKVHLDDFIRELEGLIPPPMPVELQGMHPISANLSLSSSDLTLRSYYEGLNGFLDKRTLLCDADLTHYDPTETRLIIGDLDMQISQLPSGINVAPDILSQRDRLQRAKLIVLYNHYLNAPPALQFPFFNFLAQNHLTPSRVPFVRQDGSEVSKLCFDVNGRRYLIHHSVDSMLQELGHGSFGRARQCVRDDNQLFVVKKIQLNNWEDFFTTQIEFELSRQFDHPNLLRSEAFFTYDGGKNAMVLMPKCQPCSSSFNPSLFYGLLQGLIEISKGGFSHNDFKIENVFLAMDGTPKIADWGLAADEHIFRRTHPTFGGSYYPPEAIDIRKNGLPMLYDITKIDSWAFGVALLRACGYSCKYAKHDDLRDYNPTDLSHCNPVFRFQKSATDFLTNFDSVPNKIRYPLLQDEKLRDLICQCLRFDHIDRISVTEIASHPYWASQWISPSPVGIV